MNSVAIPERKGWVLVLVLIAMVRTSPSRASWTILACAILQFQLLSSSAARALDPGRAITQYVQSSWSADSGLPQNSVHAIAQTSDGYLWIGTEEGLARFDGVRFVNYNRSNYPGLPSNYIQTLAAGADGTLWIGTDSGLAEFRRAGPDGTLKAITTSMGLSGNSVSALWEGADGVLWVGTSHGLDRILGGHVQHWQGRDHLRTAPVSAIVADSSGTVWVGTSRGVYQVSGGSSRRLDIRGGWGKTEITSLAAARDGSVWVGTLNRGIAEVRQGRVSIPPVRLPTKSIEGLLLDKDGGLWIAFDRNGIGRLYEGKLALYSEPQGLPSERSTRAIFEDREGSLWFGMLDAGLLQLRDGKFAVFGKPEGLSGNYVGNILQVRDGSMWIGADSNGLNHLLPDGRVEIWNHSNGLPKAAIYSLLQRRDGSLWVGYRNGVLARIHNRHISTYTDPATTDVSLNALFEDRDGRLWLGFWGKGLVLFDHGRFRHFGSATRISQIAQSPDGALWIATDGQGVQRFFRGSFTRFDVSNGLPSNHVMSVYPDAEGDVWVGAASGGLSRIRGHQVVTWTTKQGLPESTVGSILEGDAGDLWLGGDAGIYSISKRALNGSVGLSGESIHPVRYGTANGLRSRETLYGSMPSAWKARDGRLWFATIRGAAVIDPPHALADKVEPPVWIEHVLFDSRSVPLREGARLGPGSGNLEVAFTAPSFVEPRAVHFRYRLAGYDRDWIPAGSRRRAWYTNLPPGHYTFAVQAENSNGVWNLKGASFQFDVRPPLTRTPVAYVLYAGMAILLWWGVVVFRTRRLVLREKELVHMVAARTGQLQDEKAALEAARRELQIQATHDSLTGLFNRAAILEHLEREIARAVRDNSALGVVIADLDHFKDVNDRYGHLCGDRVLAECADRFREALRSYDVVGRYGGEEFLILLPGWDVSTAPERVFDLLRAIGERQFITNETELQLSCSLGVATFNPECDSSVMEDILRRADSALYLAKNSGRNCIRFDVDLVLGTPLS